MKNAVRLLLAGVSCVVLFTGICSAANVPAKRPIVVCSTTQIADFARHVVGDRCEVRSTLAPGADPHTYMPTPQDAEIVLTADLTLRNGLHLEGKSWMATLSRDANKPLATCTDGVRLIDIEEGDQKIADPHAWFSPRNAAVYVNNIVNAMIDLDPQGKATYTGRAKLFLQQIRVLDAWIREQVNQIDPQRRVLVTSHDAFNYFCNEYKFNAQHDYLSLALAGWSTGSEVGGGMTPQRRKQIIDSIRSFGAKAVFVETSVNPKLIREIAGDAGVKIGGTLYSDSMGEAGSAGETYIGMMRENVLTIVEALK